jgi:hypothetical protein
MTPERYLKSKIRDDLKKRGAFVYAPVPNGMGAASLDIFVCYPMNGRNRAVFLAIEVKAEGFKPTPRQESTMREIDASGGVVFWCDSMDSYLRMMALKGLITPTSQK